MRVKQRTESGTGSSSVQPGAVRVSGYDGNDDDEDDDDIVTLVSNSQDTAIFSAQLVDPQREMEDQIRQRQFEEEWEQRLDHLAQEAIRAVLQTAPVAQVVSTDNESQYNQQHESLPRTNQDEAKDLQTSSGSSEWYKKHSILIIGGGLLLLLAAIVVAVVMSVSFKSKNPTMEASNNDAILELIASASSDGGVAVKTPGTPQDQAYQWLLADVTSNNVLNYTVEKELQRYALATLYYSLGGDNNWTRRDFWLDDGDECGRWWQDGLDVDTIRCSSSSGSAETMRIDSNNLVGTIPPEIHLLSDLAYLGLASNPLLTGSLPTEIGLLTYLGSSSVHA